jgi:hypothetical protein
MKISFDLVQAADPDVYAALQAKSSGNAMASS